MGTGITSILLYNFPYPTVWLQRIGIVIFVLNVVLFVLLVFGNILRYTLWKGVFTATLHHTVAGMFWGTLAMGLATIVNMIAFVCVPAWGYRWAQLALGLWWIDVVLAIFINFGMIFMIFTRQTHTSSTVASVWLLPIVTSVVAAASGGVIAASLLPFSPALARSTIIVSYVVWGTGVPIAGFFMTLWIYRTALEGIPAAASLPSVFLPLGPCGQGSFGILLLGKTVRQLAYEHSISFSVLDGNRESFLVIADAIYAGGLIMALILWGLGLCWYIIAWAVIFDHVAQKDNRSFFGKKHFSVGYTAFTFPIGVFGTASVLLGSELDSAAFRVIGALIAVQVTFLWLYVFAMCCWKTLDGSLFVAAELVKWDGQPPPRWNRTTEVVKDDGDCV
ncbi:hypothetical protein P7C73_g3143, partial [Tremellales sp. Uapishka_1]